MLKDEAITIFAPPIEMLRAFLDCLDEKAGFTSIRVVILGGDVLFRRDVEKLWPHLTEQAVIVHHLSSSESGLLARTILHFNSPIVAEIVPLGFPVPEKEILILNQEGKLLRGSTPGEIAVRAGVIFPGYWHQPETSADKFRPDPADPKGKVFCTGDLGYFLPDGQLVFLGRKDFRVKIRGFSVDCASVESAMMAIPEVKRVVVVPQVDPGGYKRLVAYVVPAANSKLTVGSLRASLSERIPTFMMPTLFLFLPELPLTSTLKVDRKALVPPDWSIVQTTAQFIPPENEIERQLVSIWQRVLGLQQIGIDDPFFEMGGDSLRAGELFIEIRKSFGVRLPLRTLIDHESIRKIAGLIQAPTNNNLDLLLPLSMEGKGLPVFLLPGGNGDLLGVLQLARYLEGRQPIYGLQAAGIGGKHLYRQPVEQVAAQFLEAIRTVQARGPYRLIGASFGGVVAYEMAVRLREAGESVNLLGMIDTFPPGPRRKANLLARLSVHWRKLSAMPVKKYPKYFVDWWKVYLVALARREPFKKLFRYQSLDSAIRGTEIMRVGRTAYALYRPPFYSGKVVIFRAKDKPWYVDWDPMAGWGKYIHGEINVVDVDGTHGLVYKQPYVAGLAKAIRAFL
jgi:thioesterase domain-containing protein/acyl carrier protein